jgi:hypothetical protein
MTEILVIDDARNFAVDCAYARDVHTARRLLPDG